MCLQKTIARILSMDFLHSGGKTETFCVLLGSDGATHAGVLRKIVEPIGPGTNRDCCFFRNLSEFGGFEREVRV